MSYIYIYIYIIGFLFFRVIYFDQVYAKLRDFGQRLESAVSGRESRLSQTVKLGHKKSTGTCTTQRTNASIMKVVSSMNQCVARVRPTTSQGITDLLLPRTSFGEPPMVPLRSRIGILETSLNYCNVDVFSCSVCRRWAIKVYEWCLCIAQPWFCWHCAEIM